MKAAIPPSALDGFNVTRHHCDQCDQVWPAPHARACPKRASRYDRLLSALRVRFGVNEDRAEDEGFSDRVIREVARCVCEVVAFEDGPCAQCGLVNWNRDGNGRCCMCQT